MECKQLNEMKSGFTKWNPAQPRLHCSSLMIPLICICVLVHIVFNLHMTFWLPLLQPERFVNLGIEPPKGVLLFGPPGTGKTLCARAVANRTDACFIRVIGSELVQKYVGEVRASTWWRVEGFADFPCGHQNHTGGEGWRCLEAAGAGAVRQITAGQAMVTWQLCCHWWEGFCSAVFHLQFRRTLELGFCSQFRHLFFSWLWGKLFHLYFWV